MPAATRPSTDGRCGPESPPPPSGPVPWSLPDRPGRPGRSPGPSAATHDAGGRRSLRHVHLAYRPALAHAATADRSYARGRQHLTKALNCKSTIPGGASPETKCHRVSSAPRHPPAAVAARRGGDKTTPTALGRSQPAAAFRANPQKERPQVRPVTHYALAANGNSCTYDPPDRRIAQLPRRGSPPRLVTVPISPTAVDCCALASCESRAASGTRARTGAGPGRWLRGSGRCNRPEPSQCRCSALLSPCVCRDHQALTVPSPGYRVNLRRGPAPWAYAALDR